MQSGLLQPLWLQKTRAMKLSLVIPTRERAEYLAVALRSALQAADRAGCPVEVVVADNASTDATPGILAGAADPRFVLRRSARRLSMRENFEFALSHTTGSHIVFIGDDDAVVPNGLRILAGLIRAHDPDIVKWRVLNYLWPDPSTGQPGRLKIRPQVLDGRLKEIAPQMVLDGFARAEFRSYHDGGMIYHGCVARRLIERAVAGSGGVYFRGSSPDVFTSMQALLVADRPMLRINLPISMGGASPRSNGAAGQKAATTGKDLAGSEYARFIAESQRDPDQCRLPASCQSLDMVVLDCLQTAAAVQGKTLQIDLAAWQKRIAQDIAGFAEPARSASLDMAREFFGMQIVLPERGKDAVPQDLPKQPPAGPASGTPATSLLRHRLTSLSFAGGDTMSDAAQAANLLDRLLDLDRFDQPKPGLLAALSRIVQLHARARAIFR